MAVKEFCIIPTSLSSERTVIQMNELAQQGWEVIGITDHQVFFSRDKAEPELLQE
jgi:hypothetical protein